jgi:hypothetical protein
MKQKNHRDELSKKAHVNRKADERAVRSAAEQRQEDRQNQIGRGSGEGKSGLQRGDGHPTGR